MIFENEGEHQTLRSQAISRDSLANALTQARDFHGSHADCAKSRSSVTKFITRAWKRYKCSAHWLVHSSRQYQDLVYNRQQSLFHAALLTSTNKAKLLSVRAASRSFEKQVRLIHQLSSQENEPGLRRQLLQANRHPPIVQKCIPHLYERFVHVIVERPKVRQSLEEEIDMAVSVDERYFRRNLRHRTPVVIWNAAKRSWLKLTEAQAGRGHKNTNFQTTFRQRAREKKTQQNSLFHERIC